MTEPNSDAPQPDHGSQPAGGSTPPPSPAAASIGRLAGWLQSPAGLKHVAWIVGSTLAVALVSGVLYAVGSAVDFTSAPTAFGAFLTFAGISMGAGIGTPGDDMTLFSLGTLLAAWAVVHVLIRWHAYDTQTLDRAGRAILTGLEAVVAATLLTLLTGFASVEDISSRWITTWLVTFLVVIGAAITGGRAARRARPTVVTTALRETVRLHAIWLTLFAPVMFVAAAITLIREDIPSGILQLLSDGNGATGILALLPTLGNFAVGGVSLAYFGALTGDGALFVDSFSGGETSWAWDLADGHGAWLIGLGLIAIVVAAIRVGVNRPRTAVVQWNRTWQLPALTVLLWILLTALLAGMRTPTGTYGFAWWTAFTVTIAAATISVLAEFAPATAYSISPQLTALLGGRAALRRWLDGTAPAASSATPPPAEPTTPETPPEGTPDAEPRRPGEDDDPYGADS